MLEKAAIMEEGEEEEADEEEAAWEAGAPFLERKEVIIWLLAGPAGAEALPLPVDVVGAVVGGLLLLLLEPEPLEPALLA